MDQRAAPLNRPGPVTAVLGPTNTGKTHLAIERMLGRETGILGLPLRLLAREIYDRIVALRGPNAVSLITGEEKILPSRAKYHVCTVEAMPLDIPADFIGIDEIQMCADPERGHVFTDRLLRARGQVETMVMGAGTMRPRIANLVPQARFEQRERFSTLTHTGQRKLSRLKPRTAVVAFSVEQVYAIAELIRRQRGGAAVVMGALSPRTRNAQVALYQQGEVDYLVATDAIGMGLNMDVDHVAFAGLSKFDGQRHRALEPNELAQIAGRAGRYTKDGSFGTTGEAPPIDDEVAQAICDHRFAPVRRLMWRSPRLVFASIPHLIASLEEAPASPDLARGREAEDLRTLRQVSEDHEVRALADHPDRIRLLWEVCQTPDFRKTASQEHSRLVSRIYRFLLGRQGAIPSDWLATQIRRIDRTDGDIDTLSKRLAFIRTWTYVATRGRWMEDAAHWRATTRMVEDKLSDALHARLTQRFVDRRTSVLMRRLKQKERLVADVNENGEVSVEGEFLGRISGFRFTPDETATSDEVKTLRSASTVALQAEFARRADRLYLSPDGELDVTEQGGLMWGTDAIGRLEKGDDPLQPKVRAFVDDIAGAAVAEKVERRLSHWVQRRIQSLFEPLVKMRDDEALTGLARGIGFRLTEEMGIIPRRQISDDVKSLGQEERALLRKHGVRFGQYTIFMPLLLKPAPTRLRILLWSIWQGFEDFPSPPPPGHVTMTVAEGMPQGFYDKAGYKPCGTRAVRIDMLERLADLIRPLDGRAGFEASPDMLSITGCTLDQLAEIMQGLGYQAERGERPKPMRAPAGETAAVAADEDAPAQAAEGDAAEPVTPEAAAEGTPDAEVPDAAQTEAESTATPTEETAEAMEAEPTPAPTEEAASDDAAVATESADTAPEPQVDAAPAIEAETADALNAGDQPAPGETAGVEAEDSAAGDQPPTDAAEGTASEEAPATGELEVFYTFTLRPRRSPNAGRRPRRGTEGEGAQQPQGGRRRDGQGGGPRRGEKSEDGPQGPRGKGKPKGKPRKHAEAGSGTSPKDGQRKHQSRPRREEKPVDPDSPFAILQKLKTK